MAASSVCRDALMLVFPPSLPQCAAGSHFCTAKELTEEIRSLTLEREGLEGLLHKLLVLSSRNVQKLGSVKEAYNRLRQELDQGRTAYGKWSRGCPMKYAYYLLYGFTCTLYCEGCPGATQDIFGRSPRK